MCSDKIIESQRELISTLAAIFFISGFSALIYQVCWQRLLFTGFGVDLTSVTIIISIFMVGLGVGAFYGGRVADKFKGNTIFIFCLIEFLIGVFGFFSNKLILFLQDHFVYSGILKLSFLNFILLLFPTFLMGSTLPLLTSFFNNFLNNVGESIGVLYFYNTLGASFGALGTGFIFFNYIGLSETIYIAATLNMIVAISGFIIYGKYNEKL
ncbi:fused MFS/spermidine synthase [Acinetobacter junii]|uniref:fused MFS/spermidine synthase n=1 Tax=Acinetobacter junii TaxID=40215 RepID=UPI002B4BA74E|nr:fused MFS/spermidine synthase [Acinetobacter junii]WRL34960.1 fused MFS/spermidine synthase [Acinetobacter junii]